MKKCYQLFLTMLVSFAFMAVFALTANIAIAEEGPDSSTAPAEHIDEAAQEIFVDGATALLIEDTLPWGCDSNNLALEALGITYDVVNSPNLNTTDLSGYKFIMYASDQYASYYDNIAANIDKISGYVEDGGLLVAHACDLAYAGGNWTNILPGGVGHVNIYTQSIHITDPNHCVVNGLDDAYFANGNYTIHGYFTDLLEGTIVVMINNSYEDQPTYIDYEYGRGRVMASMHTNEWTYAGCYGPDKSQFLLNELQCANDWEGGGFPGEVELEAIEAKLDGLAGLPTQLGDLTRLIQGLVTAVEFLEAKSDALEAKLDNGAVITQDDLAEGQGGVWFMGAKNQPKPTR